MSNLVEHAKKEMQLAWPDKDTMQDRVKENIVELLTVFSNQGHSGFSASYVLAYFQKLANYDIISPLTGEDAEWVQIDSNLYQNSRDGSVFKDENGAYWSCGIIFEDTDGSRVQTKDSKVKIESFPWVKPEVTIIKRG